MKRQVLLAVIAVGALWLFTWLLPSQKGYTSGEPDIAFEAKLEPELRRRLLEGKQEDRYRVIVELDHQVDVAALSAGASRPDRRHQVVSVLQATAQQTQAGLVSFLRAQQAEGLVEQFHPYWVFNGVGVTANADTLFSVAARPEVRMIRLDRWRQWVTNPESWLETEGDSATWNISQIRADLAWNALGQNGEGVTVAIMDTGVDWQHPALQAQYRGYKPDGLTVHPGNWFCTTDEGYLYPVDGNGHGTHVTGIAVAEQDPDGTSIGVAPGAQWIAVKMLNDAGYGYDSWIHAAFEWVMAPEGDPALAPDVVNGSWGAPDGANEVLRPDVQALRAAGIVPIFAAGNNGPHQSSMHNPASYPESLAVGATDQLDLVTTFSSRGPSPWNEVKPEVVAPGAQIRSSLPGGTYGTYSGTSMAAPHVTGLVALLLQADPTLSVGEIEEIITTTALPLGDETPGNYAGWGRIDAYRATAVAAKAGFVTGQVTRLPDHQPLPTARITASDHTGSQLATIPADEEGIYRLALPPDQYTLRVHAFGYLSRTIEGVAVQTGLTTTVDFGLSPLPTGVLWGQVTNIETGGPVGADISALGTPAATAADPQTGQYSLVLPAGTYRIQFTKNGYRRHVASQVEIVADQDQRLDIALTPAPTLLLVDSGNWYYGSQAGYFERALDGGDYVYDMWPIRDLATDVPQASDLHPYDIVVWTAPLDAPGLIGAGEPISTYLDLGGNLFLSGQDVGFWDSGLSGVGYSRYFRDMLKAEAVDDDASRDALEGLSGELLAGLSLPMNGPDSAENQYSPDAIAVLDPKDAVIIGRYADDGDAALCVTGCQSYRGVYLASGLEGLGDQASRTETMDRILTWLDTPHPPVALDLYPQHQEEVWLQGSCVTYTIELRNLGQSADRFDLEFSPSDWSASAWDSTFSQPLTQSRELGSCQTQTLGIQVNVPPGVSWNTSDTLTLTVRSRSDPSQTSRVTFVSKAPAPLLLVDDHRWRDVAHHYRTALDANHLPYDVWRLDPNPLPDVNSPSLARLRRYPVVVWFTAADWVATLTGKDEARLATYLDGGGRLLLSSQEYLYTSGFTSFASDYLGVIGYAESLSVTQVMGAAGSPVVHELAPIDLEYPFRNYSDALRFSATARPAFWGQHGQPVALTQEQAPWKTAFFGFALEAMPQADLAPLIGQAVGWLSPLGDSSLLVDHATATAGDSLAYTLQIRNTGPRALDSVSLSNTLPISASYVDGSLEGPATYDPTTRRFTWTGALAAGKAVTVRYRAQLDATLPPGSMVRNVAHLEDKSGLALERSAVSRIETPDLSSSAKLVSKAIATPGEILTYTITLRNTGLQPAAAELLDPWPPYTLPLADSAWSSGGQITATEDALVWRGSIAPGEAVILGFAVTPGSTCVGLYAYNRANLKDGWSYGHPLEAYTRIETRLFFPLVLRQH